MGDSYECMKFASCVVEIVGSVEVIFARTRMSLSDVPSQRYSQFKFENLIEIWLVLDSVLVFHKTLFKI